MNWLSLLSIFAKPLGAAINNALAAAGASAVLYASQKGIDANLSTAVVGALVSAASMAISGFAATQGVQIPIIRQDPTNGVTVVKSADARKAGIVPVNGPLGSAG